MSTALSGRPDVAAFRLGIASAEANVGLQRANRFADAYVLFQPYTYQNNAPYGKQSGTSWALGITVPLPVYNRNQGNIERAKINVYQSEVQLAYQEKRVEIEVRQAIKEYQVSREIADRIRVPVLPDLKQAYTDRLQLFQEGEVNKFVFLDTQRQIQRDGQGLSRRGGASSPQHVDLEHGRRPANLAVIRGEAERRSRQVKHREVFWTASLGRPDDLEVPV